LGRNAGCANFENGDIYVVLEDWDEGHLFVIKSVQSTDGDAGMTLVYKPKEAAAPYGIYATNGELIISFQTDEDNQKDEKKSRMKTIVSTDNGVTWSPTTIPYDSGIWNTLFMLHSKTVLAGSSGVKLQKGTIVMMDDKWVITS
jgi:hypothetical protein